MRFKFAEDYPAKEARHFLELSPSWYQAICKLLWGGPDGLIRYKIPHLVLLGVPALLEKYGGISSFLTIKVVLEEFIPELNQIGEAIADQPDLTQQLIILEYRYLTCSFADRVLDLQMGVTDQLPDLPVVSTSYNITSFIKRLHLRWEHAHADILARQAET